MARVHSRPHGSGNVHISSSGKGSVGIEKVYMNPLFFRVMRVYQKALYGFSGVQKNEIQETIIS